MRQLEILHVCLQTKLPTTWDSSKNHQISENVYLGNSSWFWKAGSYFRHIYWLIQIIVWNYKKPRLKWDFPNQDSHSQFLHFLKVSIKNEQNPN